MKIEIEKGYPYDNPFARGFEYRLRILRDPIWFFTRQWCRGYRRWWQFPGDYFRWLRK